MATTQTLENSVSLLLCSFFQGSLKINALARYLELSQKFNFSKDAILIDGTASNFELDSVKSKLKPDLYVLDKARRQLILIESKVNNDTELRNSQISEDENSYLGIINNYSMRGWKSHLVFIHSEEYLFKDKIKTFEKNKDNVSSITWNKFISNIDNDSDFNFFKNSLINLGIDGVDSSCENDFFSQPVDFVCIRPMLIAQQKIALAYIKRLFEESTKSITNDNKNKKDNKQKSFKLRSTQYIRNYTATPFGDYPDNTVIEYCIDFRKTKDNCKWIYVVLGFDFAKNKFAIYYDISNGTDPRIENWIYNHSIDLPLYSNSYKELKESICDNLKNWVTNEYGKIKELY